MFQTSRFDTRNLAEAGVQEWCDSPEYLEELEKFLAPLRHTVFWNPMWLTHTDVVRFQAVLELLRVNSTLEGKRVLDSGCGVAGLLITLHQAGAAYLVGIESDPNVYRLAALRTSRLPQIRIIQDDTALLTLEAESFDFVISNQVIEHVADYQAYLRTLARLLRPGGVLLIMCPNRLWPFEAHSQLPLIHFLPRPLSKVIGKWAERTSLLPHNMRDRGRTSTLYETDFTYFRLKRLLLRNGFEILEMNHPRYLIDLLSVRGLGSLARAMHHVPLRVQWYVAVLFSKDLIAVCRKGQPSSRSGHS